MTGKRNKTIGFRVTPEEKLMIKQAAEAFQKTVSGYIRDIILGISGDIVNIRTLNFNTNTNNNHNTDHNNNLSYKLVKSLNAPPPSRKIPESLHGESNSRGRGSVLDFKNCMAELKKVLKERVLMEC